MLIYKVLRVGLLITPTRTVLQLYNVCIHTSNDFWLHETDLQKRKDNKIDKMHQIQAIFSQRPRAVWFL